MSLVQAVDVIIMAFATKLSPLTEEMPDRAEEYSVPLEKGDVSVADRGIPKEFPFFFSLLKRKKEAKKEKLTAYPCPGRQCITRLAVYSIRLPTT